MLPPALVVQVCASIVQPTVGPAPATSDSSLPCRVRIVCFLNWSLVVVFFMGNSNLTRHWQFDKVFFAFTGSLY